MSWLKDLQNNFLQDVLNKNKNAPYLQNPERINAYGNGYYVRLENSIHFKFDVLSWYADSKLYTSLVEEFTRNVPPAHYNINYYGLEFLDFLQQKEVPQVWVDLATAHYHLHLAKFDKHQDPVKLENFATKPMEKWPLAQFSFQKSTRLFTTKHPVHKIFRGFHKDEKVTVKEQNMFYVTYQDNQKTYFEALDKQEYAILSSLMGQTTLGDTLADIADPEIAGDLFGFFHKWQTYGLITDIQFS